LPRSPSGAATFVDASALRIGAAVALLCFGVFRFVKPRAPALDDDARQPSRADAVVVSHVLRITPHIRRHGARSILPGRWRLYADDYLTV
jgi:hypothetical protein